MFKEFLSYRSHILALIVLLAVSFAATQIPLFNYLGYEFSALIALVWSLIAGLLTISFWNKGARSGTLDVNAFAVRSLALCLTALIIPLTVIAINALFVKNCSFLQGTILFLLVTVPGVIFAHAISVAASLIVRQWRKTVFVSAWLVVLVHILYVTLIRPQIFAFNPILGYFPGLTYDETLDVNDRLLLYRAGTIAFGMLLVSGALALHRRRAGTGAHTDTHPSIAGRVAMLVLVAAVIALFIFSNQLGLSSSESSIQQELGGKVETAHFVISYPDTLLKGPRLEQVIQLHEFYYYQLVGVLRVRPARKIHTYLYATQDQKGRLIGASGTNIAKPWLWQLHINSSDVDGSLRHELVHVLAAEFGFPLLRIGVNSGLIEGLAMAVEREEYEEPVHRLAAMVFAADVAPDVRSLFTLTGFMRASAGVSYILAGSFCQYLIDRYGMRRFKLLYGTGEFSIIYGKSLPLLLQEWRRSLDRFRFNEGDLEKAGYLFKRRSIFGKECARVIANLNKETHTLLSTGRLEEALASADRSLGHTTSAEAIYQKTTALLRLSRYTEAIEFAQSQLRDTLAAPSFLPLKSLLGDAWWGADSLESAMKLHAELLRVHLSSAWDEVESLRLEILAKPDLARKLKPYCLSLTDDSSRMAFLEKTVSEHPKEMIPRFLLAREKASKDQLEEAVRLLDELRPFSSSILELSRQRRLGQLSLALGRYEKAKIYYWQSLNHLLRETQGAEIEERLRFCDWMEEAPQRFD